MERGEKVQTLTGNALEGKNKGLASYTRTLSWDMSEKIWVTEEEEKQTGREISRLETIPSDATGIRKT